MSMIGHLSKLEASGLIRVADFHPEVEYQFKHSLIHEAVYASLVKQDRKRLHLVVGEVLEQLYPDQTAGLAPVLGWHFFEAGDEVRAQKYYTLAGNLAMSRYALPEAVMHFSRVLEMSSVRQADKLALFQSRGTAHEILGNFQCARADQIAALRLARKLNNRPAEWQALLNLGLAWASRDYAHTSQYYQRALRLAREINDPTIIAHSLNRIGNWYVNNDQPQEAVQFHEEALTRFQELNDQRGIAETLDYLGLAWFNGGDVFRSAPCYQQAVLLLKEINDRQGLSSSLANYGMMSTAFSASIFIRPDFTYQQSLQFAQEALEVARQSNYRAGEAYALGVLAYGLASIGDYSRAIQMVQTEIDISREIGHRQWLCGGYFFLGLFMYQLGNLSMAQSLMEEALTQAREIGSILWLRLVSSYLSLTYLELNQVDKAESIINTVLPIDEPAQTMFQRTAWCSRVQIALAEGDPERALQFLEQIISHTKYLSGQSLPIRLSYLRGKAFLALDRLEEAEADLEMASQTVRAYGEKSDCWRILSSLHELYQRQERFEEAEDVLQEARKVITQIAEKVEDKMLREIFRQYADPILRERPKISDRNQAFD